MTEVDTSARGRLLDRIVDYGSNHGLAEHSLRTIASGVGSSHRMLIHHFGSRDEMLVSVVQEVERRQLVALAELGDGELLWERLSDPSMAPLERLFFELYAQALLGAPWGERFLDGIVDSWVDRGIVPAVGGKGGGIAKLDVGPGYVCRPRNGVRGAKLSEHGHGKAIDLMGLILKNGQNLDVLQGWRSQPRLFKSIHSSACGLFGTVLGPKADRYHQNHIHVDTIHYRSGTYCR